MKELLKELCTAAGVGGQGEAPAAAAARLRPLCDEVATDRLGNVTAIRRSGEAGARTLLLEAHIDEIGFVVTGVDDKGFLRLDKCGGIDRRVLPAAEVTVWADRPYAGVFCSVPPHLAGEHDPLPEIPELGEDIGMTAEEARAAVPVGTRVSFRPHFEELAGSRVCAKALDNRAGVAAVIAALELLKDEPLPLHVAVLLSVQEELGCRGAATGAFALDPQGAIAVDVSFAVTHDADPARCGRLGGGVMLGFSPVLDAAMTDRLQTLCEMRDIPWQPEGMGGRTGTDADMITVARGGVPTALLSIPLRYMHTPIEVADVHDVEAVAALMAAYIREGGTEA